MRESQPFSSAAHARTSALTRREALAGGMGFSAILLALPALAQPRAPGQGMVLKLRAEAITAKLGDSAVESRLFRLVAPEMKHESPASFPVFRFREGEAFSLEIENQLAQPVSFHIRGLRGPSSEDGVAGLTGAPIAPGAKGLVRCDARQSGTFILQPAFADHVPEQVARGLCAAVIIEEKSPPAFDEDLVLAVGDWRVNEAGALAEEFLALPDAARVGRLGNRLSANYAPAPLERRVKPGARLRIRMINVSNARMIPIRIDGFAAEVYAIDSTPCQPFDPLKRTVVLAPASRIEMALQAPGEAGKSGAIEAKLASNLPIMRLTTHGESMPARTKPAPLPDPGLPPAIRLQDAVRADMVITGGVGLDPAEAEPGKLAARFPDPRRIYQINGRNDGFAGKPLASLKRGRVFVLALHNKTAWPQVIAVHGHAFRLLHPFDDGWEPYFLDNLYLAPNTVSRIALIADNPGKWAIRASIAEHFAAGVASWFEVT
ncbi:MAG: multicopper oxidase family protein [Proteobacteria bacterium]|nr:multicopper oxidase family protein [Pseudomonadota bacterium]